MADILKRTTLMVRETERADLFYEGVFGGSFFDLEGCFFEVNQLVRSVSA